VKTSREAAQGWDKPVELLFIDGDHDYEAVREDFELWFPHLINGGTIAIHDSTACLRHGLIGWPGPRKVVKERIFRSRRFREVDLFGTMVVARKCEANTLADRIRILAVRVWKTSPDTIHAMVWLLARNRLFKGLFTTAINKLLAFKGLPVRSA
jgi:hypothetical protein